MQLQLVDLKGNKAPIKLIRGDNCSVEFKDIIYRHKEGNKYRLKYNAQVNNEFPACEMEKFAKTETNIAFLKDIIWYYEKETRILIKVNENLIDKELFKNADKSPYRIELTIPDECYKDIDLCLSPAYGENDREEIDNFLKDESIIKFNYSKILSGYSGQINIDLCKKCEKCNLCDKKTI